jgi:hypothetical protein
MASYPSHDFHPLRQGDTGQVSATAAEPGMAAPDKAGKHTAPPGTG